MLVSLIVSASGLSGCLVTDQIDLPAVPQSPPVVSLKDYDDGENLILFERSIEKELVVNLEIRDEDLTEPLRARWRIVSKERPPGSPMREYSCPEPLIPGTGSLKRDHKLTIFSSSLAAGKCSRVDFIVSASFKDCDGNDDWDDTTQVDDDSDVGRLSFWIWDVSGQPLIMPDTALALTMSCPVVDYRPPSPTASATSATTAEQ